MLLTRLKLISTSLALTMVVGGFTLSTGHAPSAAATEAYLANLDIGRLEELGMDFPVHLLTERDQASVTDYDYAHLARVEARLAGVSRHVVLREIFDRLTADAETDVERHLAIHRFLGRAAYHDQSRLPMHPDGSMVTDPLVLLELAEMHCGQVARVAVDLFRSAGYAGRVVQLGGHVIAEIYYEGDWHYLDADLFSEHEVVRMPDGRIPSVAELSRHPHLIDTPFSWGETWAQRDFVGDHGYYPSFSYFSTQAYDGYEPMYYVKAASRTQELSGPWFGWKHYETIPAPEIILRDFPQGHHPGPPVVEDVSVNGGEAHVRWQSSRDPDGDLAGYRVYLSSESRGWDYRVFFADEAVAPYWPGGWQADMHDNVFREPPHDLGLIETRETEARFQLPAEGPVYVSVVAYDRYGERIGRRLFPPSNEMRIERGSRGLSGTFARAS